MSRSPSLSTSARSASRVFGQGAHREPFGGEAAGAVVEIEDVAVLVSEQQVEVAVAVDVAGGDVLRRVGVGREAIALVREVSRAVVDQDEIGAGIADDEVGVAVGIDIGGDDCVGGAAGGKAAGDVVEGAVAIVEVGGDLVVLAVEDEIGIAVGIIVGDGDVLVVARDVRREVLGLVGEAAGAVVAEEEVGAELDRDDEIEVAVSVGIEGGGGHRVDRRILARERLGGHVEEVRSDELGGAEEGEGHQRAERRDHALASCGLSWRRKRGR
jgi:hypothetical protein